MLLAIVVSTHDAPEDSVHEFWTWIETRGDVTLPSFLRMGVER